MIIEISRARLISTSACPSENIVRVINVFKLYIRFQFFNAKGIYCHMKYTRTQEIQNYTDEI